MMPTTAPSPRASILAQQDALLFAVNLSAVIVTATPDEPRVLAVRTEHDRLEVLPSGPLAPDHRTLEAGLRAWVEQQTDQHLGYVEQLYTFGGRDRTETDGSPAAGGLAIAYLALVHEAWPAGSSEATWQPWYGYFPWEDWRVSGTAIFTTCRSRIRGAGR
jgi:hypothetical protein